MANISFELDSKLAGKLKQIIRFFGGKDLMFDKFVEFHLKQTQREIARMQADLDEYERKYEMSSASFYKAFDAGDLTDSKDFTLWSGIYEMQLASKERLKALS